MKYERITEHKNLCGMDYIKLKDCDSYDCANCISPCDDAKERLAELEAMIESGQAVILPCKVGDTVYVLFDPLFVADVFRMKVKAILIDRKHIVVDGLNDENNERYSIISDYIFPTKEAAEAKLKELRGER